LHAVRVKAVSTHHLQKTHNNMAAALDLPPAPSIASKHGAHSIQSCPACGTSFEVDVAEVESARKKVVELEAQMELLKEKTTTAGMCLLYCDS
jgi:hypothetical protein